MDTPAKKAAQSTKQPPRKRTESASKPVKLVRKGRKPAAGAQLSRELSWSTAPFAAKTLITQAARIADRLEVIARLLSGDAATWLAVKVDGQVAEVRLVGIVQEERQQSEVLRKLIMDIQAMRAKDDGAKGGDSGDPKRAADPLVQIVTAHYPKQRA
ncbi:hypothetical protein [Mycolicibacterium komossense]|uniref:Terminase small subunit n=1 Tax=Mycolicibacterium komossense TaxID=1779 RepID=A0ABT3CMT2_9MYCO|nr:hypothetical protein [Mycolicibacterium komossense]MCV7230682.1 hypothetical protein [Mycolicibacterium komossense]